MYIEIRSFGFKKGIPVDSDIVMDVRFLPNPYFDPQLKEKTGLDQEVRDYLAAQASYVAFMQSFGAMIRMILPQYRHEGRAYLKIAIGCTGGRHRSVAVAEALAVLIAADGFKAKLSHRDLVI